MWRGGLVLNVHLERVVSFRPHPSAYPVHERTFMRFFTAYVDVVRQAFLDRGAAAKERLMALPGDEIVEDAAGHYLLGKAWPVRLADNNIMKGGIWLLVLVATLVAPALAARVRFL